MSSAVADNAPLTCNEDKSNSTPSKQQQHRRQQLVQRFLCPLFDQLLKFCRFVCPPQLSVSSNSSDRQLLNNGVAVVDHFHHHNKVWKLSIFEILRF